ncbi:protein LNK1-like isoform X1 [Olea europaea var. sylvestris]|uniref:protein LNK1-like isoform X1 n=1 Tax=Olea europaea var. sylvestris TaxID=158386 RepID=UPI000C1D7579|nr:protein LNK1-like isoform X1 [Olea europaea var. sylvestris]
MFEKDSSSRPPHDASLSPIVRDSIKEDSSSASDNTRISSHGFNNNNLDSNGSEVCANDTTLNDKCTAVESNSFSYPLGDISQTVDDLNFFDKNPEDEDSSDILHYDWPEIGNFEDVDRMFRSCDSTFGLGEDKEDELGWFSSEDAIGGSGDILKSDFKFFCPESKAMENISENHDTSMVNGSYSTNDITRTTASIWYSERDESASHVSIANGSTGSDRKEDVMPIEKGMGQNGKMQPKISTNSYKTGNKEMVNEHKKQSKQQNHSQRKRKEQCTGNGCFNYAGNLPNEVRHLPSGDISHETFQYKAIQCQPKSPVPDSCDYLQNAFPYVHLDSRHLPDKTSVHTTQSAVRSENDDLAFLSPREPLYASSQVHFLENSGDPPFQVATIAGSEKREKLVNHKGSQSSILDPISLEKKVHRFGDKFENQSDVDVVGIVIPAELCSSNIQESSSMNSALEDISIEAASLQQLQLVMEQLDMKTKLCIRDSLYRLAMNAEQRHTHASPNGGCKDEREASGAFMAEGSNKCTGFIDMETDTNPIDRSIAHLLFHRPSDSASIPVNDSFAFRSPSMVHGPITSMSAMDEKSINNEETAAAET